MIGSCAQPSGRYRSPHPPLKWGRPRSGEGLGCHITRPLGKERLHARGRLDALPTTRDWPQIGQWVRAAPRPVKRPAKVERGRAKPPPPAGCVQPWEGGSCARLPPQPHLPLALSHFRYTAAELGLGGSCSRAAPPPGPAGLQAQHETGRQSGVPLRRLPAQNGVGGPASPKSRRPVSRQPETLLWAPSLPETGRPEKLQEAASPQPRREQAPGPAGFGGGVKGCHSRRGKGGGRVGRLFLPPPSPRHRPKTWARASPLIKHRRARASPRKTRRGKKYNNEPSRGSEMAAGAITIYNHRRRCPAGGHERDRRGEGARGGRLGRCPSPAPICRGCRSVPVCTVDTLSAPSPRGRRGGWWCPPRPGPCTPPGWRRPGPGPAR